MSRGVSLMHEMNLKQTGSIYSAFGPFAKSKERIQKVKETRNLRYIYQNKLNKAGFQHNMSYGIFLIFFLGKVR